ncbi:2',3'-cyclic-nucleotide 3'-phosphodiesterase [Didymella exigua CBS 183.55]|uniref:2',3'-cyclic-nucleotide 3'-phosphodiesterase n=1 Tax=Didymella exigua CBS 183.55 TaxID=1150837 RepID=A0A6A5RVI3_9PLEO|nr:2',3'-cyclic-nucleotide 3'-phosphodiesterase [Didymella exigua CBS 183.55]KAF1930988.1 2',3'-cyclic-nucleotide 3'-phosphodiesterase [Didymella exigua CBS 183.55]
MPGSSLWLLPPDSHPLNERLASLINSTASHFNSTDLFVPHVTLTSDLVNLSSYGSEPQTWIDSLDLPGGGDVKIEFEELNSEDVYFRKLYIKCQKTEGLKALAKACRKQVSDHEDEGIARKWAEETYNPHVSLLYHNCPRVDATGLEETVKLAQEAGVDLVNRSEGSSWTGGRVVLVATEKPTSEWKPIAQRVL